jgi:1,4-alpha-glucan branching enzyme
MANLRLLLGFMYGHPGKKLLFMGAELGQRNEWNYRRSLDWHLLDEDQHRGMQTWVRDLNRLYQDRKALYRTDACAEGFRWIDCQDMEKSVIAFVRQDPASGAHLVFILNFRPVLRTGYRIGLPQGGVYREVLNSDAQLYGGSNAGNSGGVWSEAVAWHGYEHSAAVILPPLGAVVLEPGPSLI